MAAQARDTRRAGPGCRCGFQATPPACPCQAAPCRVLSPIFLGGACGVRSPSPDSMRRERRGSASRGLIFRRTSSPGRTPVCRLFLELSACRGTEGGTGGPVAHAAMQSTRVGIELIPLRRQGQMDDRIGYSLTVAEQFYSVAAESSARQRSLTSKYLYTKICDKTPSSTHCRDRTTAHGERVWR
jgi:hypothetical protein